MTEKKKPGMGAGPNPPSRSETGRPSIEGSTNEYTGGRFLTRGQRNQAAFIHAVTGRCSCKDVENCADCNANAWSGQLLASDSGISGQEH
jgi:hypothetical protein